MSVASVPSVPAGASRLDRAAAYIRRHVALAAGLAGLAIALASALGPLRGTSGPTAQDAIATVDGRVISRSTYDRAIAALEIDKRNPVTPEDRRIALATLIDEELLVRRGLDLGLADVEPAVRKSVVDAMILLASMPATGKEPTEGELRAYYDGRPAMFEGTPLLTIAVARLPMEDKGRAERLASLLRAGVGFNKAITETGAQADLQPPALSPQRKLADYVGATVAAAAGRLEQGETAGPMEVAGRLVYVHLHERREAERPAFESVRSEVLEAWRRTERDAALESYLARLRSRANIAFGKEAPR